ncbi:MAG: Hint domain-containing protein [Oligoflexales bacterium]
MKIFSYILLFISSNAFGLEFPGGFTSETKIICCGYKKAISRIYPNQFVTSVMQQKNLDLEHKRISETMKRKADYAYKITLSNGNEFITGEGQLFLSSQLEWIAIENIDIKEKLQGIDSTIEVHAIQKIIKEVELFNFEVSDYHTYIIDEKFPLIVHNPFGLHKFKEKLKSCEKIGQSTLQGGLAGLGAGTMAEGIAVGASVVVGAAYGIYHEDRKS